MTKNLKVSDETFARFAALKGGGTAENLMEILLDCYEGSIKKQQELLEQFEEKGLEELKGKKVHGAAEYKIMMAFQNLKDANVNQPESAKRKNITVTALQLEAGVKRQTVIDWLKVHRDEVESHNQVYGVKKVEND